MRWVLALALIGAVAWLVLRNEPSQIIVTGAVIKPLEGGSVAVAGFDNQGPPDRLLSVHSPLATASIYSPATDAGLPLMTGTSALALDGAHIRLDQSFLDGTLVPLTLTFENAGDISFHARLSDPTAQGAAREVGLFGLGEICRVGEGEPAPEISLNVQKDGDGWSLQVITQQFTFNEDLVGLYHVPSVGHGHLYVGGMKLGRLYSPTARIGALPAGAHEIRVTLNTNDHRAYVVGETPVSATAVIVAN